MDPKAPSKAPRGLTEAEAKGLLARFGPNRPHAPDPHERLKEILRTLADPMALMLVLASGVYFLLGEVRDAFLLLAALAPVLGVDVVLESRSRGALKKLSQALSPRARVLREGSEREIPSLEVVPGDLLLLREGDQVPADGTFEEASNLSVDESALTGESEPLPKKSGDPFFAGSILLTGQGSGLVRATGPGTRFGKIAHLVAETQAGPTPLQRRVGALVKRLYGAALAVAMGVFLLEWGRGRSLAESFLAAVSLSIAAIPEEFPLVFTLFLTLGAWRLSRRGVLLKRLASVETLGSATVLCVDKTGTLTEGRFELSSHLPLGPDVGEEEMLEASVLACEIHPADPMERAVFLHAKDHGIEAGKVQDPWELVYDHDLDPAGKHMSHVWRRRDGSGTWRVAAKGALEGVLEHCDLAPGEREAAERENERLAGQGARVLAVASRQGPRASGLRGEDERGLRLLGLLAFKDPLRGDVPAAVALCQGAGIRLKIITGDHPLTAQAVAEAAGIRCGPLELVRGPDLDGLAPGRFAEKAARGVVFARVRPEQKFALVGALREAGEVVAMTGDGINDAPALKKADIGIAMGLKGTEVARASADMVLLSDSFAGLVGTVAEGRRIFANIQRSFLFLVSFHIPIVGLALLCPLLGLPLFYLPIHLVWLELIVHPVSALVFEAEPAPADVMRVPPRKKDAPLLSRGGVLTSGATGALLTLAVLVFYALRLPRGEAYGRSAGLVLLILGVLLLTFAERAGPRSWREAGWPSTRRFWTVFLLVVSTLPLILLTPWIAAAFRVSPLDPVDWLWALAGAWGAVGWRAFGAPRGPGQASLGPRPL